MLPDKVPPVTHVNPRYMDRTLALQKTHYLWNRILRRNRYHRCTHDPSSSALLQSNFPSASPTDETLPQVLFWSICRYSLFRRYLGINTIWYLHSQRMWL